MAASEYEAKLVVVHDLYLSWFVGWHEVEGLGLPLVSQRFPTQPVDCAVLGRGDDPTGRAGWYPRARPAADRFDERLLHSLFGDVDVAESPNQGGDGPARLLTKDLRYLEVTKRQIRPPRLGKV